MPSIRCLLSPAGLSRKTLMPKRQLRRLTPLGCLFPMFLISTSHSDDRLRVTTPPAGQECAERLVGSLATACNRGDFVSFMDHFSPTHGRRIRGHMEDIFTVHQPQMDIRNVTLLSEDENHIIFGVRYVWHGMGKPQQVMASKVTARRIDGQWKLDGEVVKTVTRVGTVPATGDEHTMDNNLPEGLDAFNPPAQQIVPAPMHLPGDIGIRPGKGCANGRCRP